MTVPCAIRDALPSDQAFIRDAWRGTFHLGGLGCFVPPTSSQEQGRRFNVPCDREHYHREMARLFDRLLPKASARVACDEEDPDTLLGFAVFTGPELHFVYVKQDFRRGGVATRLLAGLPITRFTFLTHAGNEALKPAKRGWAFTPRWTL